MAIEKKTRKCRNCRKPNQLGMVFGIGHKRPWKKLRQFQGCWKTMCSQMNLLNLLEQSLLNMEFLCTPLKWSKLLHADAHAHGRHSYHAWAIFDIVCKLSHVRSLSPFFEGFQETTCSQTELSGLPRHPTLTMMCFLTFLKWSQLLPAAGHARHRHPCQVWRNKSI